MLFCQPSSPGPLNANSFCAQPELERQLLAVIGVFSTENNYAARLAIRKSWMRTAQQSLVRFVIRGYGVHAQLLNESEQAADIVFVREDPELSCRASPLRKLMLWLKCVAMAWPAASLVGKADDDTWVHLASIEHWLHATLMNVDVRGSLYWGAFETYHWHTGLHTHSGFYKSAEGNPKLRRDAFWDQCRACPTNFTPTSQYGLTRFTQCNEGNTTAMLGGFSSQSSLLVGPFSFAKGPLYLLSLPLAVQVVQDKQVRYEAAAICSDDEVGVLPIGSWPWEDVFLGFAVALAAAGNVTQVHLSEEEFQDFSGNQPRHFAMTPSLLVWHDKQRVTGSHSTKKPSRIWQAEEWAKQHHCTRVPKALSCPKHRRYTGCRGQQWQRCEIVARHNNTCSSGYSKRVDVSDTAFAI